MKMKWTYLAVAALSMTAVAAVDAQRGSFGKIGRAAIVDVLGLSDEQRAQMKALREAHRTAIRALRTSGERPNREQIKALFSAHREQIEQILTPEQRDQIERWKGERDAGRKGRNGLDNSAMHPKRGGLSSLAEQLGLSEEQRTRLEALRSDFAARAQELHAAHKADRMALLSPEQLAALTAYQNEKGHRRGRIDLGLSEEQLAALKSLKTAYKEAHSALRQDHRERVANILTDEQAAALEALRSARPVHGQRRGGSDRVHEGRTDQEVGEAVEAGIEMGGSALQWSGSNELPTAVESTSWGRIKSDLSE